MKIEQVKKWVWLVGRNKLESEFSKTSREDGLYEVDGFVVKGRNESAAFLAEDPIVPIRGIQIFHEFWDSPSDYEKHRKFKESMKRWDEEAFKETHDMIYNVLVKYRIEFDG